MGNNNVTPFAGKSSSSCARATEAEEVVMEQQRLNFTRARGYPPRIVDALPTGEGTTEEWERHALLLSEREGYSFTLVQQVQAGYLLLRACELAPSYLSKSEWFLRPTGRYLGQTHLGWMHSQLRWFFSWWPSE